MKASLATPVAAERTSMTISSAIRSGVTGITVLALAAPPSLAQDILLEKKEQPDAEPGSAAPARPRPADHFSRYVPPGSAEMPPGAKVHVIQKGDTLWELARTYLGDPLFWPQIWEVNRYIADPHWIYPGDPLVIPQPLLIAEAGAAEGLPEIPLLPPPQPVAKRYDVYCAPYILLEKDAGRKRKTRKRGGLAPTYQEARIKLDERDKAKARPARPAPRPVARAERAAPAGRPIPKSVKRATLVVSGPPSIVSSEVPKVGLAEGDVVYISRGESDGVRAGDDFLVVQPEDHIYHPVSGAPLGIAMQMVGTLHVLCTQARTSTAVITTSCEDIEVGSLIRVLEPIPIPLASEFVPSPRHCEAASDRPSGYIIHTKSTKYGVGEEDLVNIDLGSERGLVPGDFVVVYRANEQDPDLPAHVLGDAVVLLVEPRTATAKIMWSYLDMHVGDRIRLR
jgi:LysM repeat protein